VTNLIRSLLKPAEERSSLSLDEWVSYFKYGGNTYPFMLNQTLQGDKEEIEQNFSGYVEGILKRNGVIAACMLVRLMLFSEARFQFQQMHGGRPGNLFGNSDLAILEKPWPNGTTGDLLTRTIQDADLAGNFFVTRRRDGLQRMRPDWTTIILGSSSGPGGIQVAPVGDLDARAVGYAYIPGGIASGKEPVILGVDEVVHFAPIPDPLYSYRGMSWLTPVLREIMSDNAATSHKLKFFDNGATPNLVVKLDIKSPDKFNEWIEVFEKGHKGVENAYKTLYLAGGADTTVVGADFKQMDFKVVQGAGEPLALDTPIPTPTGWTTMGEVSIGDEVLGRDGRPARVTGTSPIHLGRDCYRVTFKDRTAIVADAGHLWLAIDQGSANRAEETYTTEALRELTLRPFNNGVGGNRVAVPAPSVLDLKYRDLLVDPYVLGAWLGDGQTAGAAICGAPDDLAEIAREVQARGYTVTQWATVPGKVDVIGLPGGLLAGLKALGVLGDKHIPTDYLRASTDQRLDLLRGLMDTDGTVGHRGRETCEFSSKWERLARQVAELARSLGYRATLSRKEELRSRTGETWRVTFRADPEMVPFLLRRKADRCTTAVHVRNRSVVSIEPVPSVPVRCIAVDTADHLFLAGEGFVPTHNTRIAAAAGVPPIVVGLSEGLQSATYSNYGQACRRLGDITMRPLWRNACGSYAKIVTVPSDARLWYDDRDIPFLQEDQKDAAAIQQVQAACIRQLVDAGFQPDAVIDAITSDDFLRLLHMHTGLYSVQLQPPNPSVPSPAYQAGRALAALVAKQLAGTED